MITLRIEKYRPENLPILFEYWQNLSAGIPYFFPVSEEQWEACLLADRLDGEVIFKNLETHLAFEGESLVGFVQFGQPNFAWNEQGEKIPEPSIGVIRHIFFEKDHPEAGQALLAKADNFLTRFPKRHAFYHILGMSCNAHHGKLHSSLTHVETLLFENHYRIEHENVYYVLEIHDQGCLEPAGLEFLPKPIADGKQRFEACLEGVPVGSAEARYLEHLTGGYARDTAYMTWIGIEESLRGRGFGSRFLGMLAANLQDQGVHSLHTDTASTNLGAQRFYEKFGFRNGGHTRSYWKRH